MKFFVRFSVVEYEDGQLLVLDTIGEVVDLLNQHAENPDFRFSVIEGRIVEFEAIEVVKRYRRKV